MKNATVVAEQLERLGFKKASAQVKELTDRKRKLALAYEHYRFVRVEKVGEFNAKLKKATIKGKEPYDAKWQELTFVSIAEYDKVPPPEVLAALETAHGHKCFDRYEVAYIFNVDDPILFGRIDRCSDRFFIAQWDDDVRIEDILAANEG